MKCMQWRREKRGMPFVASAGWVVKDLSSGGHREGLRAGSMRTKKKKKKKKRRRGDKKKKTGATRGALVKSKKGLPR